MTRAAQSSRGKVEDTIGYIREEIPRFDVPAYEGERYEALAPDTLDLQERAALAVNGLTGPTDPEADYEVYFAVFFNTNPPTMAHDWSDAVQCKFQEALPLMRVVSGSDLNAHVDRRWMEVVLHMQGPDGLLYFPTQGRPWAQVGDTWGSAFCPSVRGPDVLWPHLWPHLGSLDFVRHPGQERYLGGGDQAPGGWACRPGRGAGRLCLLP